MLRTFGSRGAWLATLLGLAPLVAACDSTSVQPAAAVAQPAPASETWASKAVKDAATAQTAFGRTALTDGVVTRDEYEKSVRALIACGKSRGQTISAVLHYGLYVFSAPGDDGNAAFQACVEGDIGKVQGIYYGQFTDPDNRGEIVTSECLVRLGFLPHDYRFRQPTFDTDVDKILDAAPADSPAHQIYERCMYNPLDRPA